MKNIHQRLAEVMSKVTYIQKDKKQGMRYSIVSHDVVTAKVRPALLEAGIVYYPTAVRNEQVGNRTQCHISMAFVNIDDPEDFIMVESFGYGIDEQDKGPGKAMSYAVKYALLKTLGLETGDDPDMDQNSKFNDPSLDHVRDFTSQLAEIATSEELKELYDSYSEELKKAQRIDKNIVNVARQVYAKRKKEITNVS